MPTPEKPKATNPLMQADCFMTQEERERAQMERLWGDDGSLMRVYKKGEPVPDTKPVRVTSPAKSKNVSDQLGTPQR